MTIANLKKNRKKNSGPIKWEGLAKKYEVPATRSAATPVSFPCHKKKHGGKGQHRQTKKKKKKKEEKKKKKKKGEKKKKNHPRRGQTGEHWRSTDLRNKNLRTWNRISRRRGPIHKRGQKATTNGNSFVRRPSTARAESTNTLFSLTAKVPKRQPTKREKLATYLRIAMELQLPGGVFGEKGKKEGKEVVCRPDDPLE